MHTRSYLVFLVMLGYKRSEKCSRSGAYHLPCSNWLDGQKKVTAQQSTSWETEKSRFECSQVGRDVLAGLYGRHEHRHWTLLFLPDHYGFFGSKMGWCFGSQRWSETSDLEYTFANEWYPHFFHIASFSSWGFVSWFLQRGDVFRNISWRPCPLQISIFEKQLFRRQHETKGWHLLGWDELTFGDFFFCWEPLGWWCKNMIVQGIAIACTLYL